MEPFAYSRIFERPLDLHLAFHRDVSAAVSFVLSLHPKARRALEVQCGPAYFSADLSRRGLTVTATDTRRDILEFARSLWPGVDYQLQHPCSLQLDQQVDLVLLPLDSLAYLVTDQALAAFFQGVSSLLAEDGLFLIEANHPKDVGYIDYGPIYGGTDPRFPGVRVRAEWGVNHPRWNLQTQLVETVIRITVEEGTRRELLVESTEKLYFPREIGLLAARCGLELFACFGGWQDVPLDWSHEVQVFGLRRAR